MKIESIFEAINGERMKGEAFDSIRMVDEDIWEMRA